MIEKNSSADNSVQQEMLQMKAVGEKKNNLFWPWQVEETAKMADAVVNNYHQPSICLKYYDIKYMISRTKSKKRKKLVSDNL